MDKIWLVLKHEYWRHVGRKRFILAVLSMPLFIVVIIGVGILAGVAVSDYSPVGYVDNSGFLKNATPLPVVKPSIFERTIQMVPYEDTDSAQQALSDGDIQAYYVIHEDYLQSGNGELVSLDSVGSEVTSQFRKFLRVNLLRGYDPQVTNRIIEGAEVEIQAVDDDRALSDNNILVILLPLFSGILFLITVNISGGYLLQAVVEEKENRTMEIMVTSVSPTQLMAGKVIGNLSVGLTQLLIWILFGAIGVIYTLNAFPELVAPQLDAKYFLIILFTFLPAFVMVAAMMTALGATTTELKEAQQYSGLFSLPIAIPFWFMNLLIENPNSPFSIFLSIFPFTAPISLPLRVSFSTVPTWQIIVTILILVALAVLSLWLAGRAFRLGMLRYGKRLSLRELFRKTTA